MRSLRVWTGLLLVVLTACGSTPLTRSDLEVVVYQDGDAPAGWSTGQFRDKANSGTTDAELIVARDLEHPRGLIDGDEVAVLVYADTATAKARYPQVLPGVTADGKVYEVGEEGKQRGNIVIFQRCRAVAYVRMTEQALTVEQIGAYARRLDERLQPLVC